MLEIDAGNSVSPQQAGPVQQLGPQNGRPLEPLAATTVVIENPETADDSDAYQDRHFQMLDLAHYQLQYMTAQIA